VLATIRRHKGTKGSRRRSRTRTSNAGWRASRNWQAAPNARIAAKEALAARDIAGMDDDVRPPPALAPDALRAVNWVQT
jgi:hypothetical protein